MDRTLSAFFDNRSDALSAADELVAIGISREHIAVVSGSDPPDAEEAAGYGTDEEKRGFLGSVADLFVPEAEELDVFREGVDRRGTTVVAKVAKSQLERARGVFEKHAAVELRQH